jgi:hypothetical protein
MDLQPFVGPWPLFQFVDPIHRRGISPSQGLYLHTEQHEHRINAHDTESMPWVGFEPTIPAFERAKIVHVLDRAATVIGQMWDCPAIIFSPRTCLEGQRKTTKTPSQYSRLYNLESSSELAEHEVWRCDVVTTTEECSSERQDKLKANLVQIPRLVASSPIDLPHFRRSQHLAQSKKE